MTTTQAYGSLQTFLADMDEKDRVHERRYLCRHDLYYLLRYELNRRDVEHPWILDRCREVQANHNGYLDLWSRFHYKSTIITYALTIQDILASHGDDPDPEWRGVEPCFGIFSHTRPIAKQFLRQIKTEFETNDSLIQLFPDVLWADPRKQSPKWAEDDGLVVRRRAPRKESTVEAWGLVDGQPTSKHFTVRVYDDVVVPESVSSAEMIQKTTERWELSLNLADPSPDGGRGIERYVGTRYNLVDTYQEMMERGTVKVRIRAATDDGTVDGNPVLMTQAAWDDLKRDTSPYILSCQQLLNPTPDVGAFFSMEPGKTLRYYDPTDPPQHLRKYGVTDGAVSKDEGDWTVHIVYGLDPNDDIYLLDLWRRQADMDTWIDAQIALVAKHRGTSAPIVHWRGESGVIERSAEPFRNKRMQEMGIYYDHDTLPSITDMVARCASFQGRWKQGKVYLPRGAPWVSGLVLEMQQFPWSTVNDQIQCLSLIGRDLDDIVKAGVPRTPPNMAFNSPDFIRAQIEAMGKKPKERTRY